MNKGFLFVIAGTGLLLAGCKATDHRYQMIPVDGAPSGEVEPGYIPVDPPARNVSYNKTQLPPPPVDTPAVKNVSTRYTPMTGVKATGGVDSASGSSSASSTVNGVKYHTVQRGEYPGLIAQKYKITLRALMKANNLNEKTAKSLRVGQKLVIPTGADAAISDNRRAASTGSGTLVNGKHKVQRGETLDVIARRYKVKLSELMRVNNMTEDSARKMQVGQLLTIPGKTATTGNNSSSAATATRTSGNQSQNPPVVDPLMMDLDMLVLDTDMAAADIAAKYNIPLSVFQEINGGLTDARLYKGAVILVPKK